MPVQKTILDYYDEIFKMYPSISLKDIKRILQYGWKSLYLHNSYGGDVLINLNGFWFYMGQLTNSSLKHFNYYKRKMSLKLRVLFKRKKILWDGYYYFALSEKLYQDYLSQINSKGRPRKKFNFSKIVLYKIYDECSIMESNKIAIFKVSSILDLGMSLFKDSYTTDKAELILLRKPLTFNDILVTNYNYQFIKN